jgi:hypothetical protein
MWHVTAQRLSGGFVDIAAFAPPAAVLGLAATWTAHAYAPYRFTWRRGLIGALVAALLLSPLAVVLVTFAAAWNPASFLMLFTVGAWGALASGVVIGALTALVRWLARSRRRRAKSAGSRRWVPAHWSRAVRRMRAWRRRRLSLIQPRAMP